MSKACLVCIHKERGSSDLTVRLRRHRLFIEVMFLDYVVCKACGYVKRTSIPCRSITSGGPSQSFDYKTIGRAAKA